MAYLLLKKVTKMKRPYQLGDILQNKRGKVIRLCKVESIQVIDSTDTHADWITTTDKSIYGSAIQLEDEGWFKAKLADS